METNSTYLGKDLKLMSTSPNISTQTNRPQLSKREVSAKLCQPTKKQRTADNSAMIEPADLRTIITSAFQSSQSSTESHRSLCLNLKVAHSNALKHGQGGIFQTYFVKCVDRLLTLPRKDQCASRVVDFIATYTKLICPEEAEIAEDEDDEEFEQFVQFVENVIERYVPGFESRLVQVRFRCVSLVGTLVPLAPLNENLLASLEEKAIELLRDSDSRVRVQAVILVSRFDLSPTTTTALSLAMQHDPSTEVRLVATFNVAHGSKDLTMLASERVRDSGAQIRRGLYSKVLRTIDFRTLSINARENIVRAGLSDRDESVKRAAMMLVANRWVSMSDNNIELVLQRLDVIGHTDIADLVLAAFFELRRDVVEQLEFGDEFWSELWIEDTVLLRGFQEFCHKEKLDELLYERMPELTTLASKIDMLWEKYVNPETYEKASSPDEAEDLRECLPFMVEQLLFIASRYDLDDEASRQRITAVIGNIVMSDDAPSNTTIEHIGAIQRRLNSSDTALVSWAFEMLEAMPTLSTQNLSDEMLLTSLLRALSLFNAVLARVSSHDVAAYLPSLYTTYILPALQSPVMEIRAPALKCLGLACLLDSKFASAHVGQFAEFITSTGEQLMQPSPRTSLGPNDSDEAPNDSALVEEAVISIGAMTDMLLVHTDNELPAAAIAKLWLSLLRSKYVHVQGAVALSLAKLLLSNVLEEPLVVTARLVVFYFENTHGVENNETRALTQQQLTLFLRVYCLFGEGKQALANVFTTVFEQFRAYKALHKSQTKITAGDVVNQILELTVPDANQPPAATDSENEWHHAHAHITHDTLRLLLTSDDTSIQRSLAPALSKVELADAPLHNLQKIRSELEGHGDLNDIPVAGVRNALLKFREYLNAVESKAVSPPTNITPAAETAADAVLAEQQLHEDMPTPQTEAPQPPTPQTSNTTGGLSELISA